jgi:hypothetical protein
MSAYALRRRRRLATAAFAFFCAASFFAYYSRSQPGAPAPGDPMVFSMSVEDSGGDVLARPVVVGEPGQKVQVRLVCEADPQTEKMHLTLDPMGVENGQLLYSYELSVAGHVDTQRGTVKLSMGRERRIRIHPNDSKGVTLSLYAESLGHYLKRHKTHQPVAS